RLAVAELQRYLRGRDPQDLVHRLQAGIIDGGKPQAPVFPNELAALDWMLHESASNDVVAVTALGQRPEIFSYLRDRGGVSAGPDRIRSLVRRGARIRPPLKGRAQPMPGRRAWPGGPRDRARYRPACRRTAARRRRALRGSARPRWPAAHR